MPQILKLRAAGKAENSQRLERERSVPLLKYFGSMRVVDITLLKIQQYQLARTEAGISPATVGLECRLIKYVMVAANVWDRVKRFPEICLSTSADRDAHSKTANSNCS